MTVFLSNVLIPTIFALIIGYGLLQKVNLFDSFTVGAVDGFKTVYHIAPTIIGLMVAVGVLRASGALELIARLISPVAYISGIPKETIPLALMRLVSSSASAGLILELFEKFGPDSFIGRYVSIMMSCTETVFYTMSVYFMSVKITKTRHTLPVALIINFSGVLIALIITRLLFGS